MKNLLKICLSMVALMFFFGAFSVVQAKPKIEKVLKKMVSQYRSLKSLETNLKLEKFNSQLEESDIATGFLKYIPQHRTNDRKKLLRIDFVKPVEEQISLVGNEVTLYRPRLKQVYIADVLIVEGTKRYLEIFQMSVAELKAAYDVKYLGKKKMPDGTALRQIEMTPKVSKLFKTAFFWIDKKGLPVSSQIIEYNGDWTKINLSSIRRNRPLDSKKFVIQYPKNIKPIKG